MIATAPQVCPTERRQHSRLPLEQDVVLSLGGGSSVVARGLDLSPRGIRVQLPIPIPETAIFQVAGRSGKSWGAARVGRMTDNRHEAVLVFRESPPALASLYERVAGTREIVDGAPMGRATAEQALGRARDVVSLTAVLARGAAAYAERARVFWASSAGWAPIVESDGHRLRWGHRIQGQRIGGVLFALPVGDAPDPPLLLLVEGQPRPEARQGLERLVSLAARAWEAIAPGERRFLAWCALRLEMRRKLLDGLEDRSLAVREASAEALECHGVDTLGYAPDLSRAARSRLRSEIEEMADFREWWLENIAID